MDAEQVEEMWRRCLVRCGPLALEKTMQSNPAADVHRWAAEQLDKPLLAAGFRTTRH